jgi:hypothetical protein
MQGKYKGFGREAQRIEREHLEDQALGGSMGSEWILG